MNLSPVSAAELAAILDNGRIRHKAKHICTLLRQRDPAMQEGAEIVKLLLPIAQGMREEIVAMKRRRPQGKAYRESVVDYVFLRAVLNALQIMAGGGSEGLMEVNEEMLALAREVDDGESEAMALGNQAVILGRQGESVRALERQREAIEVRRRHGVPERENISGLNSIARTLLVHLGDPVAALAASDEAMAILSQEPDVEHHALCAALEVRGMILYRLGRTEQAIRAMITAQEHALQCGHVDIAASVTITLVDAFYYIDDYSTALEYARAIETLNPGAVSPRRKSSLCLAEARVLTKLGEYDLARDRLRQVEELIATIHTPMSHFQFAERWGELHRALGDAGAAEQCAQEALAAAERGGLSADFHFAALLQRGAACEMEGRIDEAEALYREVETRAETLHPYSYLIASRHLARLYEGMGKMDEAEGLYQRIPQFYASDSVHETLLVATERLAAIARERGEYRNADTWFQRHHDIRHALEQKRHGNQLLSLRIRYRIDMLEEQTARERAERERAHTVLNSTQADLATIHVDLVEVQNRFDTLRTRIKELSERIASEGNREAMRSLNSLVREIERSALADRAGWQVSLHKTNEEFRARLHARHPELTPALVILCECIRSGLTNDTLADVLRLSPAAVDKRRHRLRKVLGLEPHEKLERYLQEL